MHWHSRITFAGVLCLSLALAASACGGRDQNATAGDTAAGSVEASTPVQVAEVTLGKGIGADKRVTNQTDTFGTRDTIYASVRTTGSSASGTQQQLAARWTFQDGQVVDERTEMISPSGEAYTEFHISKPSGWPAGRYTLRILLNGSEVQTKEFTVR